MLRFYLFPPHALIPPPVIRSGAKNLVARVGEVNFPKLWVVLIVIETVMSILDIVASDKMSVT